MKDDANFWDIEKIKENSIDLRCDNQNIMEYFLQIFEVVLKYSGDTKQRISESSVVKVVLGWHCCEGKWGRAEGE